MQKVKSILVPFLVPLSYFVALVLIRCLAIIFCAVFKLLGSLFLIDFVSSIREAIFITNVYSNTVFVVSQLLSAMCILIIYRHDAKCLLVECTQNTFRIKRATLSLLIGLFSGYLDSVYTRIAKCAILPFVGV